MNKKKAKKFLFVGAMVMVAVMAIAILAMNANAQGNCERLQYGNFIPYYYWNQTHHGYEYFSERFTMPFNGHLTKAYITVYEPGSVNVTGEGIDIIVWDDNSGLPGTELGRVNVPYDEITWFPSEMEVNLAPLNLYFTSGHDFHVGYTAVNQAAGNDVAIISDDGSGPILNRSSGYYGVWETMYSGWGIDVDFLIAAEVCGECIIYVPENYSTIQQAVDNASDGCTIIVGDGIYRENVVINKNITLTVGSSPIIDGMGGIGIWIQANNTLIENMTITNCSTGIYVHNDSFTIHGVTLLNNTICNATGNNAYGIYLLNATDSMIINNHIHNYTLVTGTAYGIYMENSNHTEFINLTMHKLNMAVQIDYGIYLYNSNWNNFSNVVIYDLNGDFAVYGTYLKNSDNNSFNNIGIHNLTSSDEDAYGIYLDSSDNNNFTDADMNNIVAIAVHKDAYGVYLEESNYNSFVNVNIKNLTSEFYVYGVDIEQSVNNTFNSIIIKEIDGVKHEPVESLTVLVPEDFSGKVIEIVTMRKGEFLNMEPKNDRMMLEFSIPSRGIIGLRNSILTATEGEAIIAHRFKSFEPWKGDFQIRINGALISMETGTAIPYAIWKLIDRGKFYISPNDEVYAGQVIGEHSRAGDLVVNVNKTKKLSNMRAAGSDDKVLIPPKIRFSLEEYMEIIREDEYLEVTPRSLRLRKIILSELERKRAGKAAAK